VASGNILRFTELWVSIGWISLLACIFFAIAGFASIKAVQTGPLGVSWTVLRCSIVLPVLASIFWWDELPLYNGGMGLSMRLTGILLTLIALFLVGTGQRKVQKNPIPHRDSAWLGWLVTAFLAQGGWEIMLRATGDFKDDGMRSLFLVIAFGGSCLFTLPVMVATRARLTKRELSYGLLLGGCSFLGTGSRVLALRELSGTVVFPASTASIMILVQIAGLCLWKERIGPWGTAGLLSASLSVALLCL
jgi:multidrug transporter EmrE-like cation transporter